MIPFATIKKLPRQRTLTREGSTSFVYANNDAIQRTIASNVSENWNFTDNLKQGFIRHHLLFMKSVSDPYGKLAVFASQRKIVSSASAGNVPPEKKVSLVYMGVRRPFATIKKPAQADDAAHAGLALPLTAKFPLHDKHDQRDKDIHRIPVTLEREQKSGSHRFSFLAPSVYALGVSCVKRNRARGSRSALSSATNVILQEKAPSVYMAVDRG